MQLSLVAQVDAKAGEDSLFAVYSAADGRLFTNDKPYYIAAWKEKSVAGLAVIRQRDEETAIIVIPNGETALALQQLVRLSPANDRWKLSPPLFHSFKKGMAPGSTFILTGYSTAAVLAAIGPYSSEVSILQIDLPSQSVLVKASADFVQRTLLTLKEIIFIDAPALPQTEVNIIGYNRSFHGINVLDYSIPGANGKNIVAGIKEQRMDAADLDLYRRVLPSTIAAPAIESHATVIASIIGGAGNSFYDGRGLASGCSFFPSSFSNLFADDAGILNASRVTVQNHSYGTVIQQFYGAEAVSYDAQTWANKNMLHVFSAGNRGTAVATDGPYANIPGYANLTGNFKMAKNVITVGAIDNKENLPAESSAGPLYDGRMAPQLIALGPNGTSDAAAMVSGTIAVLQQVYADSNSQALPPASLVKATLFNTADDVYRTGIDHRTGYGLLNSAAAVRSVLQKKYDGGSLSQGQQWTKNIAVLANAASLRITLAWTDSMAQVNNLKALINDLDLEVTELSTGTVYKPWVLSSSP
ncbi:MAG: S8 family serine peptidase, partial [Chitinophagaceae bacterium]|nr:S8 family serine peptidase [Chitinophagaceae bacterium]